jgi:hypothetical protein
LNLENLETVGDYGFSDCTGIIDLKLPNLKIVRESGF